MNFTEPMDVTEPTNPVFTGTLFGIQFSLLSNLTSILLLVIFLIVLVYVASKLRFTFVIPTLISQYRPEKFFTSSASLKHSLYISEIMIQNFKEKYKIPAMTLILTFQNKVIWETPMGFIDLKNFVPTKLTTKFLGASLTKPLTAMIIAYLVEKKLMQYEDSLDKFLDNSIFPSKIWNGQLAQITISQLLNHTSGLCNPQPCHYETDSPANFNEAIAKFKDEPLHFKPGEFHYSNLGYLLLGAVIESIRDQPFNKTMAEFIECLGLPNTYLATKELLLMLQDLPVFYPNEAVPDGNLPIELDQKFVLGGGPSAGILTTAPDLAKIGNHMIDNYKGRNNFLSQENMIQVLSSRLEYFKSPLSNIDYTYG